MASGAPLGRRPAINKWPEPRPAVIRKSCRASSPATGGGRLRCGAGEREQQVAAAELAENITRLAPTPAAVEIEWPERRLNCVNRAVTNLPATCSSWSQPVARPEPPLPRLWADDNSFWRSPATSVDEFGRLCWRVGRVDNEEEEDNKWFFAEEPTGGPFRLHLSRVHSREPPV